MFCAFVVGLFLHRLQYFFLRSLALSCATCGVVQLFGLMLAFVPLLQALRFITMYTCTYTAGVLTASAAVVGVFLTLRRLKTKK